MKWESSIVLAALAIALCGCAATKPSHGRLEDQVRAVLRKQVEDWNSGNMAGFMEGYAKSEQTRFASGGTVQTGWEQVFSRYKAKYGNPDLMGTLSFSEVDISVLGTDIAIAFGRWKLSRQQDQPTGLFTLVFRKLPDGWRITHDHTSSASP